MIVSKITEAVIYESPDGGQTVYVRNPGESTRQLHSESQEVKTLRQQVQDDQLWHNIRKEAQTNPTLKRALDEAIMIYNLSK